MNAWIFQHEVTETIQWVFKTSKLQSSHRLVKQNLCSKFEDISSRRSPDIAFTRIGKDGRPENITRPRTET